jgi:predicted FMN-binding regulatory protein PaiB
VVIRGQARVVSDGELKTAVLNALVAKHEGNEDFPSVSPESPSYKGCRVVEIRPERMTAKADLLQNKTEEARKEVADHLVRRGLPGDLEAARSMGFEVAQ